MEAGREEERGGRMEKGKETRGKEQDLALDLYQSLFNWVIFLKISAGLSFFICKLGIRLCCAPMRPGNNLCKHPGYTVWNHQHFLKAHYDLDTVLSALH